MIKIAWYSKRHEPTLEQTNALRDLFGDITLYTKVQHWQSADDVLENFTSNNYDEMVLVLPLSFVKVISRQGFKPLWAEMIADERGAYSSADERGGSVYHYRFIRFKRVLGFELKFGKVVPTNRDDEEESW